MTVRSLMTILPPFPRCQQQNGSSLREEETASGGAPAETAAEHGGDDTASAADTASAVAWSETFDEPTSEAGNVEGNGEGHLPEPAGALEESESYADDFGEDGDCDGGETEPGHDGFGNETISNPALVGADPSLEVSDLGADAPGPEEVLPATVVGENGVSGPESAGAKHGSTDAGDPLIEVATLSTSAETAVRPPREGQGVSVVGGDTVGGSERHGTGAAAGRQDNEEDVVEAVKEHTEQEGSVNYENASLSRPGMTSADPRAPALDSVGLDDAVAASPAQEREHQPLVQNSSRTKGETPDETVDDESSGYSADGGFGEEPDAGVPSGDDALEVPSVGDELEVPESPLEEGAADVKGSPRQGDLLQEPESMVMDGEAIGEKVSEAYMSDFDDAPAETLEDNSGAATVPKTTERVVQLAAGGGGAVAVPAEGGSQAGSSVTTEGEGRLGSTSAHTEDSSPAEEYPSDSDDSSEVEYGIDIESTDVDASSTATAMTAETGAHSALASGESQIKSNPIVSVSGTKNDEAQGGTTTVEGSDFSAPNNNAKLLSGEPKEEGGPTTEVPEAKALVQLPRQEKSEAGSALVGEANEVDVHVDKGGDVSVALESKAVPSGVGDNLERQSSSPEDSEQDFEDDFEEDVPSGQPQEERQDDHGSFAKVEADMEGGVSAGYGGEINDAFGKESARGGEGVSGSADEKTPPQFAAEKIEAPRVDEVRCVRRSKTAWF